MQKVIEKPSSSRRRGRPASAGEADDRPEEVRDRLAELLPEEALQDALKGLDGSEITGPGGLISQLAGRVIDAALRRELTEHLGYPPGQAPPGGAGNHRNGVDRARRVQTDLGPVAVNTPRDRQGSLSRSWWPSARHAWRVWTRRFSGSTPAACRSATSRAQLQELYGVRSAGTRSAASPTPCWRTSRRGAPGRWMRSTRSSTSTRSWSRCARTARSETRACYLGVGVNLDGEREVLGLWWQETEGAKFWLAVLNDLHHRGVQDVLICCVDGLTGFPEAIAAVFPEAWVQTCIVHQIRASMRYVC